MALNPAIPLLGAGALLFLLFSGKKASASPTGTPEGQGGPPLGTPKPPSPEIPKQPTNRPTSELSPAQLERMALALGKLGVSPATGKLSGAADAEAIRFASQVVGELEAGGFKEAANALRAYVDEASKNVKTPVEANPIAQAAQSAGLTKEQAEYAARVLALERDPKKLSLFIDWLKKLAPSPQRDSFIQMAQALALQLEAANATTDTLDKIEQVINSSPEEPDETEPSRPTYTATSPGQPTQRPPRPPAPAPVRPPPPEQPAHVPPTPVPQPVPRPLTEIELVGRSVLNNLIATQKKYGVKGAKGKEDKSLVKKFQGLAGLTVDGNAGPATLLMLATKGALELPLVYYWPKAATAATVAEYRTALEKIAKKHEELGARDNANTLRVSIAREHGEGGINGPLFGAPATPTRPAPAPVKRPTPASPTPPTPSNVVPLNAGDPAPGARIIRRGMNGSDVVAWQQRLKAGIKSNTGGVIKTYNPGVVDGIFGGGTETATKAFQKDAGLTADGIVGPATRTAAKKMGMW